MDGVAVAGDGAVVLGARGGEAGGVAAAEVVDEDGVVPVGLDGSIAIVGALADLPRKFKSALLVHEVSHAYI